MKHILIAKNLKEIDLDYFIFLKKYSKLSDLVIALVSARVKCLIYILVPASAPWLV